MGKEYRYIGKPVPRMDGVEIVTGKAEYINDINQRDMLYGKILRSPYPHAKIMHIETSRAKKLDGVEAVLSHLDAPDWRGGVPPHVPVLDSKVRFVGAPVALVAAESEEIAEEALGLIDVDYEQLPAVYDAEEALKPDATQLYDQFPGNVIPPGIPLFGPKALQKVTMGDVENGFKEADVTAEATYAYENFPHPLPPEPPGVIAVWKEPNSLIIWSSTQGPYLPKAFLQPMMGPVNIQSIGGICGASYGTKFVIWQLILPAAALTKATGRPVKLCFSKKEHFAVYTLRLGSRIHGKVGLKKDGTVTAISGEWLVNPGAHSDIAQGQVAVGCGELQLLVRCPNWDLRTKIVCTNRPPCGPIRGFGGLELQAAFTPILAEAMEKIDLDPVEFFKKNYVKPGDGYYWRDGNWWVSRAADYTKAIEKGADVFGWKEKWKGWLKPTAVNGTKRIGVGVGVHGNADVGESTSEAQVRLTPDGMAILHSCFAESGTGQKTSLCKMVAEVLQLPLDQVSIVPPDSNLSPYEWGPSGSRGTYAIGSAVIAAAEDARRQLLEISAPKLNTNAKDLETENATIYIRGKPEVRIPWLDGMGWDRTILGYGRFEPDFTVPNFAMMLAEVEVDVETGKIELLHIVVSTDVGQIIDPLCLKNQIHGCLGAAGIDSALFEESVLDEKSGRMLTGNMIDYKWRTFAELPKLQTEILETPVPTHFFKAIGVGEIMPVPGPVAVHMAVTNAIGKRLHDYPITPEKVLKALRTSN